jgi:ABC-type nitrate/sulfonate/bicarbonate transport system substrate-binding protein
VNRKIRVGVVWLALLLGTATTMAIGPVGASPARLSRATASTKAATIPAADCSRNKAAGPITFISPFGFDASAGILDVFAAQSLGYFAAECLTVHFVTNSYVGNELVSSGAGTITGEGSAADTMVDVANGSKFVGVSTFGDTSDYAILTRKSITSLTQLEGKVLGYHAPIPVVLTEMLKAAHVDIAKVQEVNDTEYDPTLLIHGRFDGLQAYQTNEPLTLKADGDKFNEFLPSSFGVSGTFNVQVVNEKFLTDHAPVVADFLRAELHAFDYCAIHVSTCIGYEAGFSKAAGIPYEVAHETAEWNAEVSLVKHHTLAGKGIGTESVAEWAPERAAVISAGLAKSSAIPASIEDSSLVPGLYSGTTLIWPGN